jgi:hypothetical protein
MLVALNCLYIMATCVHFILVGITFVVNGVDFIDASQLGQKVDPFAQHCVSKIEKLGPIVTEDLFPARNRSTEGNNINGPSLIRIPDWVNKPVGKYLLYFGHHRGRYIRIAYADNVSGPYTLLDGGAVINISISVAHLASPDVHVDHVAKTILMYFHTLDKSSVYGQLTQVFYSQDGIYFQPHTANIARYYFRRFHALRDIFAIAPSNTDRDFTLLHRGKHGESYRVSSNATFFHMARHVYPHPIRFSSFIALYSIIFEAPERIYCSRIDLRYNKDKTVNTRSCPKFQLRVKEGITLPEGYAMSIDNSTCNYVWVSEGPRQTVLLPDEEYEGGGLPIRKSRNGPAGEFVREVRDPYVFVDSETRQSYLLYTYGGEKGIAIARIEFIKN